MGNDLKYGLVLGVVVLLIFVAVMTMRSPSENAPGTEAAEEEIVADDPVNMWEPPVATDDAPTPTESAPPTLTVELSPPIITEETDISGDLPSYTAPAETTGVGDEVVRPFVATDMPDIRETIPSLDGPEPAPVEEVAAPTEDTTYTIERGDTLQAVSQRFYGTTRKWRLIASANPDINPDRLRVGTKIVIPAAPTEAVDSPDETFTPTAAPTGAKTHVVGRGDTLYKLAEEYYGDGGQWRRIYEANETRISSPDRLTVGTELVIP